LNTFTELECDLCELETFAKNITKTANIGEIYLLSGELGVGKTTFARFFIYALYKRYKVKKPDKIKSPTYPILINYPLLNFEICHYDLYRLKDINELQEIGIFENFLKNISIIEWPEIILKDSILNNYHLINLEMINTNKRKITMQHFNSNEF